MDKGIGSLLLFLTFGVAIATLVMLLQMKKKIDSFAAKLKI